MMHSLKNHVPYGIQTRIAGVEIQCSKHSAKETTPRRSMSERRSRTPAYIYVDANTHQSGNDGN